MQKSTAATIREPLHATLLVAIEDFITGLTGDSKLAAEFRHWLSPQPPRHKLKSLIHHRTLLPRHHSLPERGKSVTYVSGTICYLCVGSLKPSAFIELASIPETGFPQFGSDWVQLAKLPPSRSLPSHPPAANAGKPRAQSRATSARAAPAPHRAACA